MKKAMRDDEKVMLLEGVLQMVRRKLAVGLRGQLNKESWTPGQKVDIARNVSDRVELLCKNALEMVK